MTFTVSAIALIILLGIFMRGGGGRGIIFVAACCGALIGVIGIIATALASGIGSAFETLMNSLAQ